MVSACHEKFLSRIRVNQLSGCWNWVGSINVYGYGMLYLKSGKPKHVGVYAHRFSYDLFNGPIIKDLVVDHICRNRACVNPEHIRSVTRTINTIENSEGASAKNKIKRACIRGHEFNEQNTYRYISKKGYACRSCIACRVFLNKNRVAAYWRKKASVQNGGTV